MRILHFYKTSYPETFGGVAQVIHQIALGGLRHGVNTDVLALSPHVKTSCARAIMPGYTVYSIPRHLHIASTSLSFSAFRAFKDLVNQADVIHYHFPWPFMDVIHFATRIKKPTVLTYHSDIVKQKFLFKLYRPLQTRFLKEVNRIVATSPQYAQTSPVLQNYLSKTTIIPLGLDESTYPVASCERVAFWKEKLLRRQALDPRYASFKDLKFFLFIGQPRYYKGLDILIQALEKTDFPTVVIGAEESDIGLQKTLSKLKNCVLLGRLSEEDKSALLTLCLSVVLPSHLRSEAFGLALLEGAMYGKPLICCDIGTGTTFINQEGVTGLVVPPNHPDALHQALTTLWNNPECAAVMGHNARLRYTKFFTADAMVQAYVKLYKDTINSLES